jgi:hypothetical protein
MEIAKATLFTEVSRLIQEARVRVARTVNSELIMLYWSIGNTIKTDILQNNRGEYGKQVVKGLSVQLTEQFGKGWSEHQLRHCLRTAEVFTHDEILYALRTQLTWTHIRSLFSIKDELGGDFAFVARQKQILIDGQSYSDPAGTNSLLRGQYRAYRIPDAGRRECQGGTILFGVA